MGLDSRKIVLQLIGYKIVSCIYAILGHHSKNKNVYRYLFLEKLKNYIPEFIHDVDRQPSETIVENLILSTAE